MLQILIGITRGAVASYKDFFRGSFAVYGIDFQAEFVLPPAVHIATLALKLNVHRVPSRRVLRPRDEMPGVYFPVMPPNVTRETFRVS
jgi:hypothetical protein